MRYAVFIATLGWLTTVLTETVPTPTDPGHLFIPVGRTYPSYSAWAITISINIAPFRQQAQNLFEIQTALDRLVTEIRTEVTPGKNSTERVMLLMHANQLSAALTELNGESGGLKRTFLDPLYPASEQDTSYPRTSGNPSRRIKRVLPQSELTPLGKTKRGLIDGIGNALNYLFGTATESEIKHLTKNVQLLNQ